MSRMETNQIIEDNSGRSKKLNRFIAKTYLIVNSDEPTACWVHGGKSFVILDPKRFSETVLPKYFKHNKLTSFVRQLNLYGFHKMRIDPKPFIANENLDNNGANDEKKTVSGGIVCFRHQFFQANQPKLLQNVQRATKQVSPTMDTELILPEHQKEREGIQNQLRETKEITTLLRDEFETKLAAARAELEIDYLHRLKALEICYKDLLLMILRTRESMPFIYTSLNKPPVDSVHTGKKTFPPAPHSVSRGSSSCGSRSLLRPNYNPRCHVVEHKLDRLSPLPQDNHRRREFYGDTIAWPNKTLEYSPAWLQLNHRLPKGKEIPFSKTIKNGIKTNKATGVGASSFDLLRKQEQIFPTSSAK